MPLFDYRAITEQSVQKVGQVEAASERDARSSLAEQGLYVVAIRHRGQLLNLDKVRHVLMRYQRASARQLSDMCRQAATMIKAGVPILTAITVMSRQSQSKPLAIMLRRVANRLQSGERLSTACSQQRQFPLVMTNMLAAGEEGGILEDVFERLASHFDREDHVTRKVKAAMFYPAFILVLSIVVVTFMVTVVLPNYVVIFSEAGASLPMPTRVLMGISEFIKSWWAIGLVVGVGSVLGLKQLLSVSSIRLWLHRYALFVPVFGELWQKREMERFARTLGSLLSGGVSLVTALRVTQHAAANEVLIRGLYQSRFAVRDGSDLAVPLRACSVVPAMVVEMVSVGEQSGAVDTMLFRVAEFYEREIDRLVSQLSTVIEPFLVVIMGGVVAFILLAIVLPMFDIYQLMQ